jgi:hypothetical protein
MILQTSAGSIYASGEDDMKISVEDTKIAVESQEFNATFEGAALTSLKSKSGDVEFLHPEYPDVPLDIFFVNHGTLGKDKHEKLTVTQLSDTAARVVISGADSDRSLLITLDRNTGDLCITPSGKTSRRGVASVRWNISFHQDADVILPCVNGILVKSGSEFPRNDRFPWPYRWNAQMMISQRDSYSCMIRSQDTRFNFKALNLNRKGDKTTLGFESETAGPLWQNNTAGGVEWRISVHKGNWKTPAGAYKDWLWKTYHIEDKRADHPEWVDDVNFAVCWASPSLEMLDALAKVHPPEKTLIHLSGWRTDGYDINYPNYVPSEEAKAYMIKANEMGFKVMPHFNYFSVYYDNPFFQQVRDFQIRGAYQNDPQGWHWPPETHDYTRMAYIHPGSGIWRRRLTDEILKVRNSIHAPVFFIDQTLCTWNTDNGLVENMTTVEGMWQLQEELTAICPDMVLAGEGLNEISFQRECFAQGHIHDGWGNELKQHHIDAAHGICSFLWGNHCRLIGYYHLTPGKADMDMGIEVYRRMGAIPTVITNNPQHIDPPSPEVKKLLELAEE